MILNKVTVYKFSISMDKNPIILVSALSVLAALGIVSSLQTFSVDAISVGFQDSKINWYDKALSVNQNNVPALVPVLH
jgi:hypothetical protein